MNAHAKIPSASTTLAARAIVVSLSISQWSGRRLDRKITDEVNQAHNAASEAGRYNKLLLPKDALEQVQKVVSETRTGFLERTLPWMDGGSRIMNAGAFLAHSAWMRGQQSKFSAAVEAFLTEYPSHVHAASKRLNGMFDPDDYPTVEELRHKFGMDTRIMPVPSSDDFRVAMSEEQAAFIKADIERNVAAATQEAVRDVYRRVAEVAERMVDRLSKYKPAKRRGEKSEGVFRDSLVENVRDLIMVLPSLNITGDPELAALADRLRPLAEWDASVLRENDAVRKDVAHQAQEILDSMAGMLG